MSWAGRAPARGGRDGRRGSPRALVCRASSSRPEQGPAMPFDIPNRFTPADAEPELFRRWESSGAFQPKRGPTGPDGSATSRFVVMIPPPNVTGSLHMGHALNNTVQDVMVRFHRKSGRETLWVPGTDHAGI